VFHDGHMPMYLKGSSITSAKVIGIRHGNFYRLMFQLPISLIHNTNNNDLCELWHSRMAHLNPRDLRMLRDIVTMVLDLGTEHQEVCKRCALWKYAKTYFHVVIIE
jgi:hypothetical protein